MYKGAIYKLFLKLYKLNNINKIVSNKKYLLKYLFHIRKKSLISSQHNRSSINVLTEMDWPSQKSE